MSYLSFNVMHAMDKIELYTSGYRYDAMFHGERDLSFFRSEVEKSGDPVLELCCGTGRLLLPLLESGFSCTGLDYSDEMISVAREKIHNRGYDVELVAGDASRFDLGRKFRTIIIGLNSLGHFTTYGQITGLLNCVSDHLADNGKFIIDIFVPEMSLLLGREEEELQFWYVDPESGEEIELWEKYTYDKATQIKKASWRSVKDGEAIFEEEFIIKMFFPQELDSLLKLSGFKIIKKYGDYDYSKFSDNSLKQLVICRNMA